MSNFLGPVEMACWRLLEDVSGNQVSADERAQQFDDLTQASVTRVKVAETPSLRIQDPEKRVSDVVRQPAQASMP